MSLASKLRRSRASTLKIGAAAFFEKLEEKVRSRKKTAMDFIKADVATVIAYNEEQERKRVAEMAKYRGYAQLIDGPLQSISSAAGSSFDNDKFYALLSNDELREDFLRRIKGLRLDKPEEARAVLNAIQVKGTGSFENKEAVIKELAKPRYKKITQPISARTPFGIGEKSFLREQQAFIKSQTAGRPELFSRPDVPEGIRRTDISGSFVDPDIKKGGTASNFRSNFKKLEADSLRNYVLSFKQGVDFTISDVLPAVTPGMDPIVNYIGIKDVKARRAAKDKVRADMLKNLIKPLLTANGEIAVEYIPIIQGSGLFSGAIDAKGEKVPSFTDEPLEGRTRVKVNDYYLKQLGLTDKETGVTGKGVVDKDSTRKEEPVIKYTSGFEERKKQFNESISNKFKDFVTSTLGGYDAEPFTEEEKANIPIKEIVDFIQENYGTGSVGPSGTAAYPKLTQEELNTIIDIIIYRHGALDTSKNREAIKKQILYPEDRSIDVIRPSFIETEKKDKVELGQVTQAGIVDSPVGKITHYKGLRTQDQIDKVVSDLKKEIDKIQRDTRKKAAKNIQQDPKSMERESQLQRDLEYYSNLQSKYSNHYYGKLEKIK